MSWLSYIHPLETAKIKSSLNGEIKVTEFFGKYAIYVDGAPQTGAEITYMWKKIIENCKLKIVNCLILGIGGGDVIKEVHKCFPQSLITAVDLDPVMVDVAKKYFGLGKIANLKINIADAVNFIQRDSEEKYDLIVVDLFIGKLNPPKIHGMEFLKNLKRIKKSEGLVLYNSHFHEDDPLEFQNFKSLLKKIFKQVKEIFAYRFNRVLLLG